MNENFMGIINLDENDDNIKELSKNRTLAAIPIAGRYRIIDFILSNMTNSGVENIGIFTKMESRSLIDHLSNGRPWDLNRKIEGLRVFNYTEKILSLDDIESFSKNILYFKRSKEDYVVMASSCMICNINLEEAMEFHIKSKNDITILYKKVEDADSRFIHCDTLNIDHKGKVVSVGRNIGINETANINMGIYLIEKRMFMDIINECVSTGSHRKVKEYIYKYLNYLDVGVFEFKGYLSCINSIKSYYRTSMDLLNHKVMNELFSKYRPIYTRVNDEMPCRYFQSSNVINSIVGNGCSIYGTVENSIVFRRVTISKGSVLKDCIVLQNCIVDKDVKLEYTVLDKNVHISTNKEIKGDKDSPIVIQNYEKV